MSRLSVQQSNLTVQYPLLLRRRRPSRRSPGRRSAVVHDLRRGIRSVLRVLWPVMVSGKPRLLSRVAGIGRRTADSIVIDVDAGGVPQEQVKHRADRFFIINTAYRFG